MCGKCEWCHLGQYRHCENTDWRYNPDGIRYGYTSAEKAPHLWGGFAQYVYLPWNAVLHHVPQGVTPELAGLATPMANGVEWSLFDGGVGYDSHGAHSGPGPAGAFADRDLQAGGRLAHHRDRHVQGRRAARGRQSARRRLRDRRAEGRSARAHHGDHRRQGRGRRARLHGRRRHDAGPARRRRAEAQGRDHGRAGRDGRSFPNFPLAEGHGEGITIKSARGHSYKACELALQQLASKRFPLEKVTTHTFGLKDADLAIKSVGGEGVPDVIHVSLMPWK